MRNLLLPSSAKVERPIMPKMIDNVYPDKEIYASSRTQVRERNMKRWIFWIKSMQPFNNTVKIQSHEYFTFKNYNLWLYVFCEKRKGSSYLSNLTWPDYQPEMKEIELLLSKVSCRKHLPLFLDSHVGAAMRCRYCAETLDRRLIVDRPGSLKATRAPYLLSRDEISPKRDRPCFEGSQEALSRTRKAERHEDPRSTAMRDRKIPDASSHRPVSAVLPSGRWMTDDRRSTADISIKFMRAVHAAVHAAKFHSSRLGARANI